MVKNRLDTLDGFRFIAIFSVLLFHYYCRWTYPINTANLYPYADKYAFFPHGNLGVQFFFIISGFVIAFTLYKTKNIYSFWQKRMTRLFFPMLLCSLITFFFCILFDTGNLFPEGHSFKNVLWSCTFLSPKIAERYLGSIGMGALTYTNGSYWSLWVELQFYLLVSIIYYLKPEKFIRNFSITAILIFAITIIEPDSFRRIFDLPRYILWFAIGVLFFIIHSKKQDRFTLYLLVFEILFQLYGCGTWQVRLAMVIMMAAFLTFIYFPEKLSFMSAKSIASIGVASYSLYLIHETIGVVLINRYAGVFGRFSFLFPVVVIAAMILFCLFSYKFIETPVIKLMSKRRREQKLPLQETSYV